MKVLWFTTSPSKGGSALNHKETGCSWIESLEDTLSKNSNIEIGVAFSWKGEKADPYKINKSTYYPISIKSVKGKLGRFYSRWNHKVSINENIDEYLKVIHDFNPDIIHIFGTENDYGMLIPKINIPCIVYIQGSLILCTHKWYNGFTKKEVFKYSKKLKLLKGYGLFHEFFVFKKRAYREEIIFKNSKFLIGRTDWDKRLSSILSPNAKYFHCDEIMRPKFYAYQWIVQDNPQNFTIISVIRNNIFKGLETIYECKRILLTQFPGLNIIWKVAGISENDEISYLVKKKYKRSYKEMGIQLLGSLLENDLVKEMISSEIFIHPSHIENSPNSLCEAMLLGMPSIATSVGGVSNILADKKEGILVQDGDPYAMAGAIMELKNNRDYAISLGINARNKAMERHNPDKITDQIMKIYSSIIGK